MQDILLFSMLEQLNTYFGYKSFRPLQEEIIKSVLNNKHALAILATGSGKSICYQLPAIISKGCCLVISPLIALMQEQVQELNAKNIGAAFLHAALSQDEIKEIYRNTIDEKIKLLYVSPERLQSASFLRFLHHAPVHFFAVDEAHCISEWGHDFRPAYRKIKILREEFPKIPMLALTATATPEVQNDILLQLQIPQAEKFISTFKRTNLALKVEKVSNRFLAIYYNLHMETEASIVYCRNRTMCEQTSAQLSERGLSSTYYHAGMSHLARQGAQELWLQGEKNIMISTNAFGMGINKANVRQVIHFHAPQSLESYYQEAGRAGRDGKAAKAILFYEEHFFDQYSKGIEKKYVSEKFLKTLYADINAFLKIPMGAGADEYFTFSIPQFLKEFNYTNELFYHALFLLHKLGIVVVHDKITTHAQVHILATQEEIYFLERNFSRQYKIIVQMLRLYVGIKNKSTTISEWDIAKSAQLSHQQVIDDLQFLHQRNYLIYISKTEETKLFFPSAHIHSSEIKIDNSLLKQLKEMELNQIQRMQAYMENTSQCRMIFITSYFGEKMEKACGICDICMEKNTLLSKKDIYETIKKNKPQVLSSLLLRYPSEKHKNVQQFIRQLLQEELISINEQGELYI